MNVAQSLEQYRLRQHALHLRRFTTGELRAIAKVSAGTVHHFVTSLREKPNLIVLRERAAGQGQGVGRPPRRYELTPQGITYLAELNLALGAQLNEAAFEEDPSLRPTFDRAEGANTLKEPAPGFGVVAVAAFARLVEEFQKGLPRHASTLYLGAGQPTFLRVADGMAPVDDHVWTMEALTSLASDLLTPWQKHRLNQRGALACSYDSSAEGPLVVRVYKESGGVGLEVRKAPAHVPSIATLDLPKQVEAFCAPQAGFVFVSGPVSSGRSMALAAMLDHINEDRCVRIVSIEEPTVFRHHNKKGVVSQRQVGVDTPDFAIGLREALRESVDVLVLTDISDHRTIEMALEASRKALVLVRVDAPDVAEAIGSLVHVLPSDEQMRARTVLAEQLVGAVSLRPCPRPYEGRKVTIVEADDTVRQLILDPDRTALLRNVGDPAAGSIRVAASQPVTSGVLETDLTFGSLDDQMLEGS